MPSNIDRRLAAPGAVGYSYDHAAAAHCTVVDAATGAIAIPDDRTAFAICGFASSSRHRIPIDDPKWLIIGLNQLYRHLPRADVWFDIHCNWADPNDNVPDTDHPLWIKTCGIPVYMIDPVPDSPTTVRYPIERLIDKHGLDYFTSTVAFMLAWSIDQIEQKVAARLDMATASAADVRACFGEYTIGIFGIDLVVGTEYAWQKACVEWWMGVAEGLGIQLKLPPETALLKQLYRYGYERDPGGEQFLNSRELAQRQATLQDRIKYLGARMNGITGAQQALVALRDKGLLIQTPEAIADLKAFDQGQAEEYAKVVAELQTMDGALQESQYYAQLIEIRQRGALIPISPPST